MNQYKMPPIKANWEIRDAKVKKFRTIQATGSSGRGGFIAAA